MNILGILTATWIIYAALYLCRVNFSIALPLINMELGILNSQLGIIASSFFIVYAVGQTLNGYLGAKIQPQKLLLIGITGSSLTCIFFGLSEDFNVLLITWMLNGYFQSIGWPTLIRIISMASCGNRLGALFGLFNTSWTIGHTLSWLLTGAIISKMNWRYGFTINGLLLLMIGVPSAFYLAREIKRQVGSIRLTENKAEIRIAKDNVREHYKLILLLASSFFIIDSIRYGLTIYLPAYIFSMEKSTLNSTLISIVFPISGSIGMILTGFLSDKLVVRKKILLVLTVSFITMTSIYMFPIIYQYDRVSGVILLILLSAFSYSIESQISSIIPVEIVGEKYSSIVAGVINSIGAIGAFTSGIISGLLLDLMGFSGVFIFWSTIQIPLIPLLFASYMLLNRNSSYKIN